MTTYEMLVLSPTETHPSGSMETWLGFELEMRPNDTLKRLYNGA